MKVNSSQPITIPNFNGGISDRAERYRELNDFEDLKNIDLNMEDGCYKRNPAYFVSALDLDVSANNAFVHTFIRTEDETYSVVLDGSGIKVYNSSGVEQTVFTDPKVEDNYLSSVNAATAIEPRAAFRAVTVGDSVLIARTDVVCRKDPTAVSDPADASKGFVWFKSAAHGYTTYRTHITDASGTKKFTFMQTAKSIDDVDPSRSDSNGYWRDLIAQTEMLAAYLSKTVNNKGNYNSGEAANTTSCGKNWHSDFNTDISAINMGSVCKIFSKTGKNFRNFETTDGLADLGSVAVWKSVRSLADLPVTLDEANLKLRVEGSKSDLSDDFYVKFTPAGYGQASSIEFDDTLVADDNVATSALSGVPVDMTDVGYWKETVGFNQEYRFDYNTMPHALVYRGDGTFVFTRMDGEVLQLDDEEVFKDPLGTGGSTTTNFYIGAININNVKVDDAIVFENKFTPDVTGYNDFPDEIVEGRTYYVYTRNLITNSVTLLDNPDRDTSRGLVSYTNQATADATVCNISQTAFKQFKFADREAGDDVTNPWPAFVDETIKDMVLHRNRLAIVSRDAVTLSEFGEFFNFFRITVQELLDTAPIEVQTTDNTTRELLHAVSYKNQLVVFSKEAQFILQGQPALTPESVSFNVATAYDSNRTTRPFVMGDRLYFVETRNNKNRLKEISEVQFRGNFIANDLGTKVPNLIEGDIRTITNNGEDKIALVSESDLRTIYLLTTKIIGNQRPINAWHRFTFEDIEVEGLTFVDNRLRIVGQFENQHRCLFTLEMDTDFTQAFVDAQFDTTRLGITGTYSDPNTTYLLPVEIRDDSDTDYSNYRAYNKATLAEYTITDQQPNGLSTQFTLAGDTTGDDVVFGKTYDTDIVFSKFYPQSRQGQGAVVNDQVVIDAFAVSFDQDNRQSFDLSCVSDDGKDYLKTYEVSALPNYQDYEEILVQARNRDVRLTLTNNSVVPFNLINFEYRVSEGRKRH